MEPCCKRRLANIAVILLMGMTAAAQSPTIQFESAVFRVLGWKAAAVPAGGWASVLTIYAGPGDIPPMLGSYRVEQGTPTFHPSFPVAPGVRYRAVLRLPGAS